MKSIYSQLIILIFSGCLLFNSCSSSKVKASPEQIMKLTELVNAKNFEINSDMAYPQVSSAMNSIQNSGLIPPGSNVNQINLIGNVNFIRIKGDSIYAELPYFGERQMNAGYNGSDASISIENTMQNYTVNTNSKDDSFTINFNAKTDREVLRFNITIFPNLRTDVVLNGPTRFPIRYTGTVTQL